MAVHQFMLSCVLATIFPDAVWSGTYCYYYYYSYYCYYYYYNYDIPIGSIIGAVVGGIISLIFLCVIIVAVCMVCCKKKTTGTVIQPAGFSTTAYNTHPQYPQSWGVQPTAPPIPGYSYSHQQPYPPPPPVSQTMPPPTYAESVVSGQPLRFSS
ncbi:protein shisa-5-like isoform X1 [Crassostrea angulata]|uniref:protein shisa-5-like isoform X1 n=1 Tax=Magallana angulata TaxID=2784310 RepID=UPI0022B16B77|nr:protein shisa-5-like isoform X1 [Crassostrea angulata]